MWTEKRIPGLYCRTVRGFFFSFYSGKAPTRLFVVLTVTIKPFDYVVTSYISHDSGQKSDDNFHVDTSSRCQVLVRQHENYIINYG